VTFDISMQGISIGAFEIRFYSLMILSGIGVGIIIAQREAKRYGEDPTHVINIAAIGATMAIVEDRIAVKQATARTMVTTISVAMKSS